MAFNDNDAMVDHRNDEATMGSLGVLVGKGAAQAVRSEIEKAPWLAVQLEPSSGNTLLMQALHLRENECALALIPFSHARHKNRQGKTALILAASGGLEECVEALLPVSDVNDFDDGGMSALMRAASKGHERAIEVLLSSPSAPAKAANKSGATALMYALLDYEAESAKLLIPHSDLCAATKKGDTPLSYAAGSGLADIVRSMLPFASARTFGTDGFTPLMIAANHTDEASALACVEALLPFSDVGFRAPQSRLWISGMSAADVARKNGFDGIAALIDGFEAAQKEKAELIASTGLPAGSGCSRKLRV